MTMGLCLEIGCEPLQQASQKYLRQVTSGQKKVAVVGGLRGDAATRQSSQCWLHSTNGFTSTCMQIRGWVIMHSYIWLLNLSTLRTTGDIVPNNWYALYIIAWVHSTCQHFTCMHSTTSQHATPMASTTMTLSYGGWSVYT